MRVEGAHHWYYERGEWKEKKIAPDRWEFTYATNKRRAWNAPEGSGVPVGERVSLVYSCAHQNWYHDFFKKGIERIRICSMDYECPLLNSLSSVQI